MDIITDIVTGVSQKLIVTEEDGWIIVTAPVKEGRYDYEAIYDMEALNSHKWNQVPSTTKVHLKGFGYTKTSYDWMVSHFGENFKLYSPC